jgi:putative Mg2+ transporter-C (MgtC) family protein
MVGTEELILRIAFGSVFGGLIGLERHVHGRPAGFRTHILVCTAMVLLMEVSEYYHYLGLQDPSYVRVDPGRIAAGAITGIGFLGAGVIIKMGASVQGLTTAASIWMVAAIGLATGAGLYAESVFSTAGTVFALLALRAVERHTPHDLMKVLRISSDADVDEEAVYSVLDKFNALVFSADYESNAEAGDYTVTMRVAFRGRRAGRPKLKDAVSGLAMLKGVKSVSLKSQ